MRKKGQHGGARPGSGRPSKWGEPTKPVRIPLSRLGDVEAMLLEGSPLSEARRMLRDSRTQDDDATEDFECTGSLTGERDMKDMIEFDFRGHEVRTVTDEHGEPWFVAKDVAMVLGYGSAPDMTRMLDKDEKGKQKLQTPGGEQSLTTVSESGLYACIVRSQREEAKPFRKWVTSEVLPSIRKTGRYDASEQPGAAPQPTALPVMTAEQKMDIIKDIIVIGQEAGDHVMVVMAHDCIKNAVAPMLYGEQAKPLVSPSPAAFKPEGWWQAFELLESLGVAGKELRDKSSWCGRLLATAYRSEFREEPKKTQQYIDGAMRPVMVYPPAWMGRAKQLIYSLLQREWAQQMKLSGALDGQLLECDGDPQLPLDH